MADNIQPEIAEVIVAPAAEITLPVVEPTLALTEKPFEHTDVPSLLAIESKDKPKETIEVKPGETQLEVKTETLKVEDTTKPVDTPKPEPELTVAPVEYKFTPPEGTTINEAQLTPYIDILKTNNIPLEVGQKLFDLHSQAIQQISTDTLAAQHRAFADMRKQWQGDIMSDGELGGSGFKTVQGAVARMRDKFVPEKHYQEFNDFLNTTGAGEHPALWRLLWNVAKAFDEPAATPAGGTPPPNHGKPPGRKGMNSLYNKSSN